MMSDMQSTNYTCPACSGKTAAVFFEMDAVPVFCNVLCDSRSEAQAAARADIHLAYCTQCDMIYNVAFDPQKVAYSPAYENSLHYSPRFQDYADKLSDDLIARYDLREKDIVEIGCGQGDFLSLLAKKGSNRAFGFDPSFRPEEAQALSEQTGITIVPEIYCEKFTEQPADLICCRHVLEHIDQPQDFLASLRRTIGNRHDTTLFFEVPNALYTLKDMGIWDIIYEHCNYFTATSLANLFIRGGFTPLRVDEQYGGQFLSIEARPNQAKEGGFNVPQIDTAQWVNVFRQAYQEKKEQWQRRLLDDQANRKATVLWGAGSKGVTFLNTLNLSPQQIEYIVDLNPRKQQRYVVGTGQEIIGPESLTSLDPGEVIIMNPIYRSEIEGMLSKLGVNAEVSLA